MINTPVVYFEFGARVADLVNSRDLVAAKKERVRFNRQMAREADVKTKNRAKALFDTAYLESRNLKI